MRWIVEIPEEKKNLKWTVKEEMKFNFAASFWGSEMKSFQEYFWIFEIVSKIVFNWLTKFFRLRLKMPLQNKRKTQIFSIHFESRIQWMITIFDGRSFSIVDYYFPISTVCGQLTHPFLHCCNRFHFFYQFFWEKKFLTTGE